MISRRDPLSLSSAAILFTATGARAMTPRQANIVTDATGAAQWVAHALSTSGYRADFTIGSLTEIDRFFDEQAPDGVPRRGGLLSEQLGPRIFAIGSYVGETLRRTVGGEWIGDDNDPEAEINLALRLAGGAVIWPVQRVLKRFKNGREDGLAAYARAVSKSP